MSPFCKPLASELEHESHSEADAGLGSFPELKSLESFQFFSRREKVAIYMLLFTRVCLNNDSLLVTGEFCHIPAVYCGDVTKRLEKGTFTSERVLRMHVFLTSSGCSILTRERCIEEAVRMSAS